MPIGSLGFKRKFKGEGRPFTDGAIHLDLSLMGFDDRLHVAKTEAKPFYVMQVAGMGAIELLENAALRFLGHSDPVVFDPDDKHPGRTVGADADQQILL